MTKKKEQIEIKYLDHVAIRVVDINASIKRYAALNLDFDIQDHHYFHSIYTKDPDNHTVELTTIVVDENTFYEQ